MLTIRGSMFLFTNTFNGTQLKELEWIAENIFKLRPEFNELNEKELCKSFIGLVKEELGITLKMVDISLVIRINK